MARARDSHLDVLATLAALGGVLALTSVAPACAERDSHLSASRAQVRLDSAPKPSHPLDIGFGEFVELIGYDIDVERPVPGKPFHVTWYWRVKQTLPAGWKLFTHLSDGTPSSHLNLDADRALRSVYPESRWQAGDYLRDEQAITLISPWRGSQAVFYLGFYKDSERMPVVRGKQDGSRRAEALRLRVEGSAAPEGAAVDLPELAARRRQGPLEIDGNLNESDWGSAPDTGPLVNTMTGGPGAFPARARVLYDDAQLYVAFVVDDDFIKATHERTDDHLWEQDTVEIMLDPDGDAKNYFELQVSPRSVHFDTRYDAPRVPRPFGHVDWDSRVRGRSSPSERGYTVEMAIPFEAFAVGDPPAKPPQAGAIWRMNFFVMDARERGQRAVGWSAPRVGDFHTLGRFGRVRFAP